jgi:DNA-binding transcriptional MerR regulator
MTIQELADRAEVTTRTIRYYVEQGVLPPPERGRPAEYTEEHVTRLALVKRLKEQYLPLEEIRDTMQRMSLPEIEALVADYSPQKEQTIKLDSASDYIANVLGRGKVREQVKQQATPAGATEYQAATTAYAPGKSVAPASPAPSDSAMREAQVPYAEPVHAPAQAPSEAAAHLAAPTAPPAPATASASGSPAPSLASRLWSSVVGRKSSEQSATAQEGSAYIQPPTSWQRVQLGEGIELHYLATSDAHFNEMVTRLVEAAHLILDEGPGTGE